METENAGGKKAAERRPNNPDDHIHQKAMVATGYAFRQPPGDDPDDNPRDEVHDFLAALGAENADWHGEFLKAARSVNPIP
jgi:hypothetical protein